MKKRTTGRTAAIVLAFAALSVFGLSAAGSAPQEADAASGSRETAIAEKQETENTEKAAEEKGEVQLSATEEKADVQGKSADDGVGEEPQEKKQNETLPPKQSGQAISGEKPDTGSKDSGTEKKETQQSHKHEWAEVYDERTVYKTEQRHYAAICNQCGLDMSNYTEDGIWEHILGTDCSSFSTDAYREVTAEQTERYVSGYACSCGATKQ